MPIALLICRIIIIFFLTQNKNSKNDCNRYRIFTGPDGRYRYTQDLMTLNWHAPSTTSSADHRLSVVSTPLSLPAWKRKLEKHPDQDYVKYILSGIEYGFRIGVDVTREFKSATQNMLSAKQNPQVIEEYLQSEVGKGNILGPFAPGSAPLVHINRFGVIPKKYQPGKWRIITDLSYPEGRSVNEAINPELCSMSYITVDQVATTALALGKGAMIAKIDIKSAYRLIPVYPGDRKWLGMKWDNKVYVDGMLPFGLRSAPKMFNSVADSVEWCVAREGVEHIFHYLDDFAVVGPPDSDTCMLYLHKLKSICIELGIPLATEKQDGPTPVITLLGIIIDTTKGELRLPEDKLQRLLQAVSEWGKRKVCTCRELESLIGVLQHAATVIKPGRSFLGKVISLLSVARQQHHHIRLNADFRADMSWWQMFATHWNGASLVVLPQSRMISMTSDASGSWGCGAWHEKDWFQLAWDSRTQGLHIAAKELIPIIVGAVVWGKTWKGSKVVAYCDNSAVVAVVNRRYCRDKIMMQLLRCLFFVEAYLQFEISASHIAGLHNELADDLSRNRLPAFLKKKPDANVVSSVLPISLLQWLLSNQEWTSPTWMRQFTTFVLRE